MFLNKIMYNVITMDMNLKLRDYEDKIKGEKKDKFDLFFNLLVEYNKKFNLTSITDEKDVFFKHFLDSAAGEFLFKKNSSVIEIGSGAGFPSVVLKILREDLDMVLIESTGKKCDFLNTIVDNLRLKNVKVLNARAEDAAKESFLREKFDFVTARAVARLNTLSEYCLPFLKINGKFIAYKGEDDGEISEAFKAFGVLGGKFSGKISYELPFGYGKRTLIVVDKVKSTPFKYPRGNGKEKKQPL